MSATTDSPENFSGRFLWVDAIRGLACVGVIMRHLFLADALKPGLSQIFPSWLEWLHVVGAAGVYAFFVLSGFVITHSLRNTALNGKSFLNFIIRRQIRLDPVYWTSLLLFLVVPALFGVKSIADASPTNLLVNFLYLQSILHKALNHGGIIGPAWTLCIEIQFYLVFILILMIGRKSRRIVDQNNLTRFSFSVLFYTGLICLGLKHFYFRPSLFFSYWHYFSLGALTYYAMQKVIPFVWYRFFVAAFALSLCFSPASAILEFGSTHSLSMAAMTVALVTSLSLFYAGRTGKMTSWGNTPILQYLGRISYTLYLVHTLVIYLLLNLLARQFPAPTKALGLYFLAFVISIAFAHILHVVVEKPSMKLATRFKTT